jgi:hypothetical protein
VQAAGWLLLFTCLGWASVSAVAFEDPEAPAGMAVGILGFAVGVGACAIGVLRASRGSALVAIVVLALVLLYLVIGTIADPAFGPVLIVLAPVNCTLLALLVLSFVRMRPVDEATGRS